MKTIISLFILLVSFALSAQKTDVEPTTVYAIPNAVISVEQHKINNEIDAVAVLSTIYSSSKNDGFRLLHTIKSLTGTHYTFIQTHQGIDVYQAIIKVNTDTDGNSTSILSSFQEINQPSKSPTPSISQGINNLPNDSRTTDSQLVWALKNGKFTKCVLVKHINRNGLYLENLYTHENELVFRNELTAHFTDVDTTAKAFVYLPDPLTVANTEYGGNFTDNNDSTNLDLDNQRDSVEIELIYENGMFILENEFIRLIDLSSPFIDPVTDSLPFFYYDRSELGFEDANVFYHITKQQHYMRSLGFTNIVNYAIDVDPHGFGGADNSAFTSGTTPPSLVFGQGGVDDAEDADVIIHEFTHAVMHSATPGTNFGTERRALDEAMGDYMAVSYSATYDIYHSDYVFNWDGHNEFWDGRLAISDAIYPDDLQFNLYRDAPLWSSALIRIEKNIGRDITSQIAIEAAYSFSSSMTMAQAAQLVIQADSLLNNKSNYAEICWVFKDKGMVDTCSVSRPDNLVGINNLKETDNGIQLWNTENFSKGLEPLQITAKSTFKVIIYDINGKRVTQAQSSGNELFITPDNFKSGSYIYKVISNLGIQTFKVIRF
jgi:hypothetical protein